VSSKVVKVAKRLHLRLDIVTTLQDIKNIQVIAKVLEKLTDFRVSLRSFKSFLIVTSIEVRQAKMTQLLTSLLQIPNE
jgi:hypothetical protein